MSEHSRIHFIRKKVNILEQEKKKNTKDTKTKTKEKLPFAVFVTPKIADNTYEDYKQIFTDIISDRIKEKF